MDTASGGESFNLDFDDNGNMTTGVSETFTYNWDNKLRSASALSGNIKYDPSGNRVRKDSVLAGDRKYIVDIVGNLPTILLEIEPGSGEIMKSYIYTNGQVLCQHDGDYSAPRYFYIHDRNGSTRQIINTSASVVRYYTYEPFGEVLEEGGTLTNYMMFTGQYFDTEIDQYYLRARQYDPHIYRFSSRDIVSGKFEEPLSMHKYLYCQNDAINRIDPLGEIYFDLNFSYNYGIKNGFMKGGIWGGLAGGLTITGGAMLGGNGGRINDYYYFGGGYTLAKHGGLTTTLTGSFDNVSTGWNSALTVISPTGKVVQIGWEGAVPRFSNRDKVWYDWIESGQALNKDYRQPLSWDACPLTPPSSIGPITWNPTEIYQWATKGSVSLTSFYVFDWDIVNADWIDKAFAAGEMFGNVPSSLGLNVRNVMFSDLLGSGQ